MGNFYTNYTLRGPNPRSIAEALRGRTAIVTPPQNGSVVVFDEETDQDPGAVEGFARELSGELICPVLAVINHDDDVLQYQLFVDGKLADEYNSAPGYFGEEEEDDDDDGVSEPSGGDAEKLCAAFGARDSAAVEAVLRKPGGDDDDGYLFEVERHADLVRALNLSEYAIGAGFNYVSNGELPEGLEEKDLLRVD